MSGGGGGRTLVEMKVAGIAVDPLTNSPIVILKDENSVKTLPIWIGILEASAIAAELEKLKFARPMTHDLLKDVLMAANASVKRVEVNDLRDNVYYATVHVEAEGGGVRAVDARPSDAIAIALRTGSAILVDMCVIEKAVTLDMGSAVKTGEKGKTFELLSDLSADAFGKYKM